jgi:2-C-methyl-D-erythritol 4-phosphate cytidylyltransferase
VTNPVSSSKEIMREIKKRQTWIVIPAAGVGKRFSETKPKQYEEFFGQTILEFTLKKLLKIQHIKVIITVNPKDNLWKNLSGLKHPSVEIVTGGETRRDSVFFALEHIKERASRFDWILVHDAVRPCVKLSDIKNLFHETAFHQIGGILATPLVGTLKRVEASNSVGQNEHISTEKNENSYIVEAQTPQLFYFELLYSALEKSKLEDWITTDESSAIESYLLDSDSNYSWDPEPVIVECSRDNIKITRPEDIAIAKAVIMNLKEKL